MHRAHFLQIYIKLFATQTKFENLGKRADIYSPRSDCFRMKQVVNKTEAINMQMNKLEVNINKIGNLENTKRHIVVY